MKLLILSGLFFCLTCGCAKAASMETPSDAGVVQGQVQEVINVENFTYLRLETHAGEIWTAVISAPVRKGDTVTVKDAIVMKDFESKILKRKFPTILFGNLVGAPSAGGSRTAVPMGLGSTFIALSQKWKSGATTVAKSTQPDALTIAEVIRGAAKLEGKSVVVSGKVVKYNADIMGRNWIHLRDGSGSEQDASNDILVTSTATAQLGDVITFRGTVRTDQDFGAGYAYKVLLEDAVKL